MENLKLELIRNETRRLEKNGLTCSKHYWS